MIKKTIRWWSQEAQEALQVCFETTDWEVLCEPAGEDINSLTDCITDYINFCTDTIIAVRGVGCFLKNKPGITKDLKKLLKKKKQEKKTTIVSVRQTSVCVAGELPV